MARRARWQHLRAESARTTRACTGNFSDLTACPVWQPHMPRRDAGDGCRNDVCPSAALPMPMHTLRPGEVAARGTVPRQL